MTVARLVLEYLDVLAWPAVVVACIFGFRRSLRAALHRLVGFEGFGVKASLEKAADEASEVVTGHSIRTVHVSEAAASSTDIVTILVEDYMDARQIGEAFRSGNVVIVDLSETSDREAKRIVDFMAGMIFQQRGAIDRLSHKLFMLTP